ncbi:MAG TPA: hypothetical protein VFX96_13895, partial [Pyrinomonadaceae bacterium]|nr:hypothetical protein [Pyrinomonadaceae bacterium]
LVRAFEREFAALQKSFAVFVDLAFDSKGERLAVASISDVSPMVDGWVSILPVEAGREGDLLSRITHTGINRIGFGEGDRHLVIFGGGQTSLVDMSTAAMVNEARQLLSSDAECDGADIKSQ